MKFNTIAMILTASFLSASALASPAQDVDVLMPNGQVRVMDSATAQQYVAVSATHGLPVRILNKVEDRQRVIDAPTPPKAAAPLAPTPTYGRNRPNYRQSPTIDVTTPTGQTVRLTDTPENRQRALEYQTRSKTGQTAQEYAAQQQLSNYATETRQQAETNAQHIKQTGNVLTQVRDRSAQNARKVDQLGKYAVDTRARTKSNEQAIQTNTQAVSDNKATMNRVDQEVKAQQQEVHANTTHVQQNSTRIDSNKASIDRNTAQINQNHNDIEDLREAFEAQAKRVDGAMAQSVANANLAMPYNVGKITTTVALGHSGEANAIAGGFGYRVTESLSVRSSVAYDTATEQVSAGAGVGYEW